MRRSGVLLPISSLPSKYGIGSFSKEAYDFVDKLEEAGQKIWQILPLGPTGYGDSPYQSFSTFAGNPYFIDLEQLIEEGLLTEEECESCDWGNNIEYIDYEKIYLSRFKILKKAYNRSNINNSQKFDFGDREKISLKDLNNKPIIIYRRYEKLIMQVLNMNDIKASIYCLNDDGRTTVAWAQAGLAIGIVPKSVINTSNREIKVYEIEEDDLKTDIAVIWLENKYLSKSARHLLDMINEMDF